MRSNYLHSWLHLFWLRDIARTSASRRADGWLAFFGFPILRVLARIAKTVLASIKHQAHAEHAHNAFYGRRVQWCLH